MQMWYDVSQFVFFLLSFAFSQINYICFLQEAVSSLLPVNPQNKELTYNPRYEELFAPEVIPFLLIF